MKEQSDNELVQLLLKRQGELNSLLEITRAINRNRPASALFEMLEVILKMHTKVGRMRLLIRDSDHFYCAARFGGNSEPARILQHICQVFWKDRFIMAIPENEDAALAPYQYFVPVTQKNDLKAFMLLGDIDTPTEFINSDLDFIQTLVNVIVVALDNKKFFIERMKRERMQRDMELASEVQAMLVPSVLPRTDRLQVAALYIPQHNIGGDYFDFIRTAEHEFIWCIADVTGKGVSAALLMANLQASLRAWSAVESDLASIVRKLNSLVVKNTHGERFITLFLGKYNEQTREMHYVNAGHNPPLVLPPRGGATLLKAGSPVIGAFDELPFVNSGRQMLEPGSLILNYTDGLIESADENVFVNDAELQELLIEFRDEPIDRINPCILAKVQTKFRARMNSDDITMLTIRVL